MWRGLRALEVRADVRVRVRIRIRLILGLVRNSWSGFMDTTEKRDLIKGF